MNTSPSAIVNVGIAGLGRSGWHNHAIQIARCPNEYRIAAVMDPDPDRGHEAEREFGCVAYTEYEKLLHDDAIDLIVVATPSHLHLPQVQAALEAGKDAVCEKPMAPTLDEARKMHATARQTGRVLTVFQNLRFAPSFLKIRQIIDSGQLGRIVKVTCRIHKFARRWDWQTLQKFGGGELNNTASHFVDSVLQLAHPGDARVFCHRDNALSSGDAEDTCTVLIDIAGSPLLEIEVSAVSAYPDEMWYVQGTRGCLKGSAKELRWKTCDIDALPPRTVEEKPTAGRTYNAEELTWNDQQAWTLPTDARDARLHFYQSLHQTLRHGTPLAVSPESVLRQIEVLETCRRQSVLPEMMCV